MSSGLIDIQGNELPSSDVWYQQNGLYVPHSALPRVFSISSHPSISWSSLWTATQPRVAISEPEPEQLPEIERHSQVIEGWRSYNIHRVGGQLVLNGMYGRPWWKRTMYASCDAGNGRKSAVQHLKTNSCSCGIYGHGKPDVDTYESNVAAKVRAWGVVLTDGEGNFRASDVEITELFVCRDISELSHDWLSDFIDWGRVVDLLRDRYAVPVRIVETLDEVSNLVGDSE